MTHTHTTIVTCVHADINKNFADLKGQGGGGGGGGEYGCNIMCMPLNLM